MSHPASPLASFVPRLVLEWAAENPDDRYRRIEGTLVFTDLSGFTAMSERMSRLGKLGAEELTVHLDGTFSEMLRVAHHRGGDLLKFGGDALLLFFWGKDHVRRGVAAAQEMRATLWRVGNIETEAGKFRLRMSVGVHSGEFDFFLVGGSHRELVITGEGAMTTIEMEGAADANEILLSPATAAALPPSCVGAIKGADGGRLLRRKPSTSDAAWESRVAVDDVDPTSFVPSGLRSRLVDPSRDAEHRQVTVTFVHFEGVDSVIAESGPDEAARRIEALVSFAQQCFDEAGITFLNIDIYDDGGKIFAQAGAPTAHENDDERMLRAVRAIADEDFGLTVRIGVNRGYVFVGEIGTEYGRTYTAMGDAVNTAARVMAKAEPGQVLSTAGVLERSHTAFDTTELPPFAAKGKKKPLVAWSVGDITGVREHHDRQLPLIGRDEELEVLLEALADAREGHGRVVEVVAEAGMGKSRLVDELAERAVDDGARVLRVECHQYEATTPYFPMRSLLRQALELPADVAGEEAAVTLRERVEALAPELVPWLPLVAIPLGLDVAETRETADLDDQFVKPRMHEAIGDLLGLALAEPIALVVEDGHWADGASVDLLRHLEGRVGDRPWLMLVSRRPDATGFLITDTETSRSLVLEPLDVEAASRLARAAAPDRLLPQHVEALVARGAGNPLFVQRLSEGFLSGADLENLPDTVEAALLAEIDELDPEDRTLLRYASVLGTAFSPGVLAQVVDDVPVPPEPEAWARLEHFVHADGDGTLRFRHALYQDVAYEGLSYRRRRAMHQRIGECIEEGADDPEEEAEALSLHFDRARDWERAFQYSKAAAERARARYALTDAAVFYERAVEAGRHAGDNSAFSAELLLQLADMHWAAYDLNRAEVACRRVLRLPSKDPGVAARALLCQGEINDRLGNYGKSLHAYDRASTILSTQPKSAHRWCRTRIDSCRAQTLFRQGRYDECLAACDAAEQAAHSANDRQALATVYTYRYFAGVRLRRPDRGEHASMALELYRQLGNRMGEADLLNNIGIDAYYAGEWQRAATLYRESETAHIQAGNLLAAVVVRHNAAEILVDQGMARAVLIDFEEARSTAMVSGYQALYLLATRNLGRGVAQRGDYARARELLDEALQGFDQLGAATEVAETVLRLLELDLLVGDVAGAQGRMERSGLPPTPVLRARSSRLQGLLHARTGCLDEALAALERSLEESRSVSAVFEEALTLSALSQLTGDESSTSQARAIFEALGVVEVPEVKLSSTHLA